MCLEVVGSKPQETCLALLEPSYRFHDDGLILEEVENSSGRMLRGDSLDHSEMRKAAGPVAASV